MQNAPSPHRYARSLMAVLALLSGALAAHGADTHGPAALEMQIPALGIGSATFSDVVLTSDWPPVSGPAGILPVGTQDAYDPATHLLVMPAVKVGSQTFYNAIVSVNQLTSIGNVLGADTYDGANLVLRNVSVNGGLPYHDVTLKVSPANPLKVGGGMPSVAVDQFDTANGR